MIIQCPTCKTKFSIDKEKFIGISRPRFHCSKCSHNFYLYEDAPKKPEQLQLEPQEEPHPFTKKIASSSKEVSSELRARPQWPEQEPLRDPVIIENYSNAEVSATFAKAPDYDYGSNLAYDVDTSSPVIDEKVDDELKEIDEYSFDKVEYEQEEDDLYNDGELSGYESENSPPTPYPPRNNLQELEDPYSYQQKSDIRFLGMTLSDAVFFSSIPIILYFVFSFFFSSKDTIADINSALAPTLDIARAQVPPGTLVLGEPYGELVELPDGNRVLIIEAEMLNNSDGEVIDIYLEADLYSRDNSRLVRKIVAFPNNLTDKIVLEDIPTEKIDELQAQEISSPHFILLPHHSKPARVAIVNPPKDAVWFNLIVRSAHWADPNILVEAGLIKDF